MVVFLYMIEVVILVVLVCIAVLVVWLIAGALAALALGLVGHAIGGSRERPGRARVRPRIPASVRRQVLARDGYRCQECGATENLVMDHIIALSRGGSSTVDNLEVLCMGCNERKGARP